MLLVSGVQSSDSDVYNPALQAEFLLSEPPGKPICMYIHMFIVELGGNTHDYYCFYLFN